MTTKSAKSVHKGRAPKCIACFSAVLEILSETRWSAEPSHTMLPRLIRVLTGISALALGLCGVASGQISPGPLSRAHQQLEGITKCSSCHDFGGGDKRLKCLECHVEIQHRVEAHAGYHAKAYTPSATQIDCARCHTEHNGQKFPLTRFDRSKFDHKGLTVFALEGKHATLQCEACHTANRLPAAAKAEIKLKDLNHSYLGLARECTACHQDVHANQLGADCVRCHSQDAWKPASGFNHFRAAYPLTGLHQSVACQKCHETKVGEKSARYKGFSFANCQSCHADPHKGAFQDAKFQGTCETCHNTTGWNKNQPSVSFNHNNTKFPLHAKHADAACAQCHKDNDFKRPVAHEHCSDCHEDIHAGQFAKRAAGAECSACHSESSFKPATFTRETHQTSAFKLEGKHAELDCVKCHQPEAKPESKNIAYMTGKLLCKDCHADPHAGEFAAAPYANRCEVCHMQTSFQPPTYSSLQHAQTKFALTGAHAAVVCGDCHKPLSVPAIASPVAGAKAANASDHAARQYHFARQDCVTCHSDPHNTPKVAAMPCETCHNVRQWKELKTFEHASTKFALEGAHQTVTCAGCHKPSSQNLRASPTATNAKIVPDFAKTPKLCFECHEDVHGGQFLSAGREQDCKACHTVNNWSSSAFNHNATSYPLDGFHSQVPCAQCHTQQQEIDGKTIRIYRRAPTECAKCH